MKHYKDTMPVLIVNLILKHDYIKINDKPRAAKNRNIFKSKFIII